MEAYLRIIAESSRNKAIIFQKLIDLKQDSSNVEPPPKRFKASCEPIPQAESNLEESFSDSASQASIV